VHLDQDERRSAPLLAGVAFYHVVPSASLGDFLDGTLDFHPQHAIWRMALGFKDGIDQLRPLVRSMASSDLSWKIGRFSTCPCG
jgi:hypothetical protein